MKDTGGVISPRSARSLALGDAVTAVGVVARVEERSQAIHVLRLRMKHVERTHDAIARPQVRRGRILDAKAAVGALAFSHRLNHSFGMLDLAAEPQHGRDGAAGGASCAVALAVGSIGIAEFSDLF